MLNPNNPTSSTKEARPSLPAFLTPLLGREREVAAVRQLLQWPAVRLVTLSGPGGIGKTRLGLQIAVEMQAEFEDGVYFVPLISVATPQLVLVAIAQQLRVKEGADQFLLEWLKEYLQDKRLLMVLDNFEHLGAAAFHLAELLGACPQLKLLLTSRVLLRISGEYDFPVPPLALPDPEQPLPKLDTLLQYPAVALFVERAQATRPDFELTEENAVAVVESCVRLDGLPLALELAAARIKLLTPQALVRRLEQRLPLLSGGAVDLPARHQTLRRTIDWSYNLLDLNEQRLFRRLAVFAGGCRLDAAETLAVAAGDLKAEVFDRIASLINQSLLYPLPQSDGEPRIMMLETIREYALEQLELAEEAENLRRIHAGYYLTLVEQIAPRLAGSEQQRGLERLEEEHHNLRAVLGWALAHQEAELALRLSGALGRFWLVRGHLREGRHWLEEALQISRAREVAPLWRAKALTGAGVLCYYQGDYPKAATFGEEALKLFQQMENAPGEAAVLNTLGHVARIQGKYDKAKRLHQSALAIFEEINDRIGQGYTLAYLGLNAAQGESAQVAQPLAQKSLQLFREVGDRQGTANALGLLALITLDLNHPVLALSLIEEAMPMVRKLGNRWGLARASQLRAEIAWRQRDARAALDWYREALDLLLELGDREYLAECLEELAELAATTGQEEIAARLLGAAAAIRKATGAALPLIREANYKRILTATKNQMSAEAFATGWEDGQNVSPQQLKALFPQFKPLEQFSKNATSNKALDELTTRELEVLKQVAQGLTNAQIAEKLVISPFTVHTHLNSIYSKLGISSRSAATRYAIEHQLS